MPARNRIKHFTRHLLTFSNRLRSAGKTTLISHFLDIDLPTPAKPTLGIECVAAICVVHLQIPPSCTFADTNLRAAPAPLTAA